MNENIKELLLETGFKIFGDGVVAADNGSSGNATICSQKLIDIVLKRCILTCEAIRDANNMYEHHIFADGADRCAIIIKRDYGIE